MKVRPILFSSEMVRAILDGRKSQTRRVVKGVALDWLQPGRFSPKFVADPGNFLSRYGYAGDRLWVRETWNCQFRRPLMADQVIVTYKADGKSSQLTAPRLWNPMIYPIVHWRPSIFMPRWASRIMLEVTSIRVERVKDILINDCWKEGITVEDILRLFHGQKPSDIINTYAELWNSINAKRGYGWEVNPWVWVIEFKKVEA